MNKSEIIFEIGRLTDPDTPVQNIGTDDFYRAKELLDKIPRSVDKAKLEMRFRKHIWRFTKERYLRWCHETAKLDPKTVPVEAVQQWWEFQRKFWESQLKMELFNLTPPFLP